MALLDILFTTLGSAVAKTILKFWLPDPGLPQELGGEIIDLLKSRVSSDMAARQGRSQFEAVAIKVAKNLEHVFRQQALDDDTRKLLAETAAGILNQLKIDAAKLAEINLDPIKLYRLLQQESADKMRAFSEAEQSFCDRVLKECAHYVVGIASRLPSFHENMFAEVLKREDRLLHKVDGVLNELRKIRESSQAVNPEVAAAQFEEDYRKTLVETLDEIKLVGLDVTRQGSRRHSLTVAYISLSMSSGARKEADENLVVAADGVLNYGDRLVVRGLAGSGKTTFVKWVAVQCAGHRFQGELAALNDRVPFIIYLRKFVDRDLPAPQEFVEHLLPTIAEETPKGWVRELLAAGRAIILIDGVDETPPDQRERVYEWLRELVGNKKFQKTKFVVTTRPSAMEEGRLAREGFNEFTFESMGLTQITRFIEHWHRAVKKELFRDDEKAELDDLEASLKSEIRTKLALRNLTANPLLCSAVCALHRERKKDVPSERLRLYEACCEMILERRGREQSVGVDTTHAPTELNYTRKRALLEDLALWMMRNGWSRISFEEADERFEKQLPNLGIQDEAKNIRAFLVERSGLLQSPVEGEMDFAHRTFQEFLAAKAIIDEGDLGFLHQNAHDDQWREVVILAAGHAAPKAADKIIRNLVEAGDRDAERRHYFHLLAVACLETAVVVDRELRGTVDESLTTLIPPKNKEDAKAIAAAGTLAATHLGWREQLTIPEAAACVHALKLIGDEAARTVLASYAGDSRTSVFDEILKDSLDDSDFHREVFPYFARQFGALASLDFSECANLKDVSFLPPELPALERLNLSGFTGLKDLASLPKTPKLKQLKLNRCTGLKNPDGLPKVLAALGVEPPKLRSEPQTLSVDQVKTMLAEVGLFDSDWNKKGRGVSTALMPLEANGEKLASDLASGLTWQQGGSSDTMNYTNAEEYVEKLNRDKVAGFDDWRLPTLEEAMTLMEPEKKNGDLYIDPAFDQKQSWIWTADKRDASVVWVVFFDFGVCSYVRVVSDYYVRAVRSGQSLAI